MVTRMRTGLSVVELVMSAGLVGLLLGSAIVMLAPGGPGAVRPGQTVEIERAGIVGRLAEPLTRDLRFAVRIERQGGDRFRCALRGLLRGSLTSRPAGAGTSPEVVVTRVDLPLTQEPDGTFSWGSNETVTRRPPLPSDREGVAELEWVEWSLDATRRRVVRRTRDAVAVFDFDPVLAAGETLTMWIEPGTPTLVQLRSTTGGEVVSLEVCPLAIEQGPLSADPPWSWSRLTRRAASAAPPAEVRGEGLAAPPSVVAGGRDASRRPAGPSGGLGRPPRPR